MDGEGNEAAGVERRCQATERADPAYLGFACLLNGIEPVDPARPFVWLDCGAQAAELSARFPHGQFLHLPDSAEALTRDETPELDFAILPGNWAAADSGRRAAIVALLARRLKPGGVVLVAYDALPGATVHLSLSRLLTDHQAQHAGAQEAALDAACDWIQDLVDAGADFFEADTAPRRQWERYTASGTGLPSAALYAADVARELSAARLVFAGSADPSRIFTEDFLMPEQEAVCASAPNPELRETLLDFLCNTAHRCDLFVRGPRALPAARAMQWFARCVLTDTAVPATTDTEHALPPAVLTAAIAHGPRTLAALLELPAFHGQPRLLQRAAARLVAEGRATVSFVPESITSTREPR